MFHFRRMGKASQPQLIVETVHIVRRGHVSIGSPAVWNIFNDTRMLEIGIVPLEELIDTVGTAKQSDEVVCRGIIAPLNHVFQMPPILVCVVQSSLSDLVKIDQHHKIFDKRCRHHGLIFINRDDFFSLRNVVNHKARSVCRCQATSISITLDVSINSRLKGWIHGQIRRLRFFPGGLARRILGYLSAILQEIRGFRSSLLCQIGLAYQRTMLSYRFNTFHEVYIPILNRGETAGAEVHNLCVSFKRILNFRRRIHICTRRPSENRTAVDGFQQQRWKENCRETDQNQPEFSVCWFYNRIRPQWIHSVQNSLQRIRRWERRTVSALAVPYSGYGIIALTRNKFMTPTLLNYRFTPPITSMGRFFN